MDLKSYEIKKGVNLHFIKTDKFKTTTLSFCFHRPLNKEEASLNSLSAMVMRRCCPMYPSSKLLAEAMDDLYGASFDTNVRKKGNDHIIFMMFSFPNEKYLKTKAPITKNVLEIAKSIIFEQDKFRNDYFVQEKENLKLDINAEINDKRSYAQKRCIEEMCKDDVYSVSTIGDVNSVDKITNDELFNYYKNTILKSPVDIFICGDADFEMIKNEIEKIYENISVNCFDYGKNTVIKHRDEVLRVTDAEQITQGKLSMGFTTGLKPDMSKYPSILIFNGILGGGAYSKLFNNVREKLSLCYYASSTMHFLKGIMLINSGIEVENFQKAYDEILIQLQDIKEGKISDEEFNASVLGTVNSLRSMTDSQISIIDYYLTQIICGEIIDIDALIQSVLKVNVNDVIEIAKSIKLNTVYFLKGDEN